VLDEVNEARGYEARGYVEELFPTSIAGWSPPR
jgi:hypothetical protein